MVLGLAGQFDLMQLLGTIRFDTRLWTHLLYTAWPVTMSSNSCQGLQFFERIWENVTTASFPDRGLNIRAFSRST
jgi:hypothetical protein